MLVDGEWKVGLIMQHLGSESLADKYGYNYPTGGHVDQILKKLRNTLKKRGIMHEDLAARNVMIWKKSFKVIDFDPEYVYLEKVK